MPGIFISYRRDDSPGHAGRIFDRLRDRFGRDVVFMDVAAIEAGVDFVDALRTAIGSCDALIAVIGPQWVSAAPDGTRRLDDPHDFVRLEIAGALERGIRVLPVLVDGAALPPPDALPADLQALTRRQALELRDSRWDDDIERLVGVLDKLVNADAPHQPSPPVDDSLSPPAVAAGLPGAAPPTGRGAQPRAARPTGRGRAMAALAALVFVAVAVAVLAWRGGLLPAPRQTAGGPPIAPPRVTQGSAPNASAGAASGSGAIADAADGPLGAPVPAPAPSAAPAGGVKVARMPDVRGKTVLEARDTLRNAGFRFLIRVFENRSREPGIVQTQMLDDVTAAGQPPRVILTAVATSTVLVHVDKGDEQEAEPLVAYLRGQPSTVGSLVRALPVVPRAEMVGRVGYSENRLAPQAEAVAKDVSEYLRRTGSGRRMTAARRAAISGRTIIVALYERAP